MANLIDHTYFFRERTIAQISEQSVSENVDAFIARYEPEIMTWLLGAALYSDFKAGLAAAPPTADKWVKLRDGVASYVDAHGHSQAYFGIVDTVQKISLIADYVYFKLMSDTVTFSTGTGEKTADAENASPAPVRDKQIRAWNDMVDRCRGVRNYLIANPTVYDNYVDPVKNWQKRRHRYGINRVYGYRCNTVSNEMNILQPLPVHGLNF
jgi:hypothetical protein